MMIDTRPNIIARPWPLPRAPWLLGMEWHDLLFMHWGVDPDLVRPLIPSGLELELYNGKAWVGVVPFRMTGVGPRYLRWLPWVSAFVETNVRTYVTLGGKPGVWFFSLDASNPVAVLAARIGFSLPYFHARMLSERRGGWIYYKSRREHPGATSATFAARYRPTGPVHQAEQGTLEYWLTQRYCLYSVNPRGNLLRCEIEHAMWPLQPAEAHMYDITMSKQLGFDLPDEPPLLHFARYLKVIAWAPYRARTRD